MRVRPGALVRVCGIIVTAIAVTPAVIRRHVLRNMALGLCLLVGTVWAGTASYYYDELGRLIETVAADGTSVLYSYDAVGNISSVKHDAVSTVGISGFIPAAGPIGTSVTIFGSGFSTTPASNVVKFNGTAATVNAATATSLVVTVPAAAITGAISVANGAASSTSSGIYVVASLAIPTISGFTPNIGAQGTAVAVTGSNFQSSTSTDKVEFGTFLAPVSTATATTLTTKVPGPASSGKIGVTTPFGAAKSVADFYAVPPGYNVGDVQFKGRLASGGAPLVITTTGTGRTGLVLFDGVRGQSGDYLELSNVTMPGGTVVVFSPDGSQLGNSSIIDGATISLLTLPITGTYTIVVAPSGAGNASMKLGTADLTIGPLLIGTILANQDGSWTIPVTFTVKNIGTVAARPSWFDIAYLSTDSALDNADQSSGYLNWQGSQLAPGASYTINTSFTTTTTTAPGNYTFLVKTDGHSQSVTGGPVPTAAI